MFAVVAPNRVGGRHMNDFAKLREQLLLSASWDALGSELVVSVDSVVDAIERLYPVVEAARRLADVERNRTDQTEHSSVWLHAHREACEAVARAVWLERIE